MEQSRSPTASFPARLRRIFFNLNLKCHITRKGGQVTLEQESGWSSVKRLISFPLESGSSVQVEVEEEPGLPVTGLPVTLD